MQRRAPELPVCRLLRVLVAGPGVGVQQRSGIAVIRVSASRTGSAQGRDAGSRRCRRRAVWTSRPGTVNTLRRSFAAVARSRTSWTVVCRCPAICGALHCRSVYSSRSRPVSGRCVRCGRCGADGDAGVVQPASDGAGAGAGLPGEGGQRVRGGVQTPAAVAGGPAGTRRPNDPPVRRHLDGNGACTRQRAQQARSSCPKARTASTSRCPPLPRWSGRGTTAATTSPSPDDRRAGSGGLVRRTRAGSCLAPPWDRPRTRAGRGATAPGTPGWSRYARSGCRCCPEGRRP